MIKKVGIAIPYYSGKDFLFKAIESVLNQSNHSWTLLISDDCSADLKKEDLAAYLKDSRIRYVRQEVNLGMVGNWNYCYTAVQDYYCTLLHSDDELNKDYVKFALNGFQNNEEVSLLYFKSSSIDNNGHTIFSVPDICKKIITVFSKTPTVLEGEIGAESLSFGNFIFCPSVCFRKDKIKENTPFSNKWKMVPDYELWLRLILEGHKLLYISNSSYRYRRHSNNTTHALTLNNIRFIEELKLLSEFSKKYSELGWLKAAKTSETALSVRLNILFFLIKDLLTIPFKNTKARLRLLIKREL